MKFDFVALIKSKIFWANAIGVVLALCGLLGVTPEMTGKTAEYTGVLINIVTIILRMFSTSGGGTQILSIKK